VVGNSGDWQDEVLTKSCDDFCAADGLNFKMPQWRFVDIPSVPHPGHI
jgi:hypothetical protein